MSKRDLKLITYYPATVNPGKDFHVSYYALNPHTDVLVRKKIRLNHLSGQARDRYARDLVRTINEKLAKGWNPFIEKDAPKSMHLLMKAIETFRRIKERELEESSLRSYNSYLDFLKRYLTEHIKDSNIYVANFGKNQAVDLMLYIGDSDNRGSITYNNYLVFFRLLWSWLIEMGYCSQNHFTSIRKKKAKDKKRIPIPDNIQERLLVYLSKNNKEYLCMMFLCYYCLLRPKEIALLRVKDINMEKGLISVSSDIAKNDHSSFRTIPLSMIPFLLTLNLSASGTHFLFGNRNKSYDFSPGKEPIDSRKIAKYWEKLRTILKIPKEMTFYSLKDTGIIQLSRDGVAWKDIQDQADHRRGDITRIYAQYVEPDGSEQIRNRASKFGKSDS